MEIKTVDKQGIDENSSNTAYCEKCDLLIIAENEGTAMMEMRNHKETRRHCSRGYNED